MRVIFAGTPEFAGVTLRRLVQAGFDIALVLTQPDRPAGRGMRLHASPVKLLAQAHGIALLQPRSLRLDGKFAHDAALARAAIAGAQARVMVVAAYGLILPQWVLDALDQPASGPAAGLGCLNIHASLLPRWRGAAPIHRAIEAGDEQTGVCIMQMDAGLDTGAIVAQRAMAIVHQGARADTTGSLHDRLAVLGADLLVDVLQDAGNTRLQAVAQGSDGICYAEKVRRSEACIDWRQNAAQIERRVRAFDPSPGAWTTLGAEVLKVWGARCAVPWVASEQPAGSVLEVQAGVVRVACGHGVLELLELQRAGGKRFDAAGVARGAGLRPGSLLGAVPKSDG